MVWGVIQVHYISCAFYLYHYDIRSTSDHQGLHPRGWGPLPNSISFRLSCKRYPAKTQVLLAGLGMWISQRGAISPESSSGFPGSKGFPLQKDDHSR